MTRPDHIDAAALGALAYRKPAAVLLTLRNHVVGADAFDRAFREYARRWAFRHPTPGDFFRTVENVTGTDLGWFWRASGTRTDVLDIGVDGVETRSEDGQHTRDRLAAARHERALPGGRAPPPGRRHHARRALCRWTCGRGRAAATEFQAVVAGEQPRWSAPASGPTPPSPTGTRANDVWGDAPPPTGGPGDRTGGAGRARPAPRGPPARAEASRDRERCGPVRVVGRWPRWPRGQPSLDCGRRRSGLPLGVRTMLEFGSWASHWWKPVLFVVIAGHSPTCASPSSSTARRRTAG